MINMNYKLNTSLTRRYILDKVAGRVLNELIRPRMFGIVRDEISLQVCVSVDLQVSEDLRRTLNRRIAFAVARQLIYD